MSRDSRARAPLAGGRGLLSLASFLALLFAGGALAPAQESPHPPEGGGGSGLDVPTPERLDSWVAAVQAASLPEEKKAELKALYEQARRFLADAEASRKRRAELDALREAAPQRLQEVLAELAKPPADATPRPPDGASLTQLEQLAAAAKAEKAAAEKAVKDLEDEKKRRAEDRQKNPERVANARTRIDEIDKELERLRDVSEDPLDPSFAKRQALLAEREFLQRRLDELSAEILSYDARTELLARRMELAARRLREAEAAARAWSELVAERRRQEAEREAERAREAQRSAARHPVLEELAQENVRLAERRTGPDGLLAMIERAEAMLTELREERESLEQRFERDRQMIETVGLSDSLGRHIHLSLRQAAHGGIEKTHRLALEDREKQLNQLLLERIALEEQVREALDAETEVERLLDEIRRTSPEPLPTWREESLRRAARRLLEDRKKLLESLLDDVERYADLLSSLDIEERRLLELSRQYEGFLRQHVLWVRSAEPVGGDTLARTLALVRDVAGDRGWGRVARSLGDDVRRSPWAWGGIVLLAASLLFVARRLDRLGAERGDSDSAPLAPIVPATLEAFARGAILGAGLLFLAWRVEASAERSDLAQPLAAALEAAAWASSSLWFAYRLLRRRGLVEKSFSWPTGAVAAVRSGVRLLFALGIPLYAASVFFARHPDPEAGGTAGRLALVLLLLLCAVVTLRLRPAFLEIVASLSSRRDPSAWPGLLYVVVSVGVPLVLSGLAAAGYVYTAARLAEAFFATAWLLFALFFLLAVIERWYRHRRRRIVIERLRRRMAESAGKEATADASSEIPIPPQEDVDLRRANEQTRRMLRNVSAILALVGLWAVWSDVLPALQALDRIEVWGSAAEPVTLVDLLRALAIALVTAVVAGNVQGALDLAVLSRLPLQPGSRYAILSLVRYGVAFLGVLLVLEALGLRWNDVQWLVAAMGVGLGFGLQEIFANFVSGLILLFERPVRVGDTVTVGDTTGTVTQIRIRATTICDWDRKELVIPNREFITGQIVNWTLSDPLLRLTLSVGVAYGSDVSLAERLLLEAARAHPEVLEEPAPTVVFREFGDSALLFELRVFVNFLGSSQALNRVRTEINRAIDDLFRRHGVEIPFPQRVVHLRGDQPAAPTEGAS